MSNSNLYEVCFLCISKKECNKKLKEIYKKNLEEIFENERIESIMKLKHLLLKIQNLKH